MAFRPPAHVGLFSGGVSGDSAKPKRRGRKAKHPAGDPSGEALLSLPTSNDNGGTTRRRKASGERKLLGRPPKAKNVFQKAQDAAALAEKLALAAAKSAENGSAKVAKVKSRGGRATGGFLGELYALVFRTDRPTRSFSSGRPIDSPPAPAMIVATPLDLEGN